MDYNIDKEPIDFDKLIIEIYDAALSRKWGRVLAKCNQVFHASTTFLLLRDSVNDQQLALRIKVQDSRSLNPDALVSLSSLSMFKSLFLQIQEGDIYDTSDNSFRQAKGVAVFINQILAPLNAEKMLGALILRDGRYEAYLGICRPEYADGFTISEHLALKRLIPHFIRAARFFRDEEVFSQQRHLAQGLYDHIKTAFVVCDKHLQVQACNTQAEEYLETNSVLKLVNHKLTFNSSNQQSLFVAKVRHCLGNSSRCLPGGDIHVVDEHVNSIDVFHIHKLNTQAERERREPMVVINIQSRSKPNWQNVQACFALDKKQLLIARMLYKETPYSVIASAVSLPEDEVRKLVKHVQKALNVKSDEALISKLAMFACPTALTE